jgi:hypothetical protein
MSHKKCELLLDLPIELQSRIFTLCQNAQIFYTCKHCYALSQTAIVRAQYLYVRFDTNIYSKQATSLRIYTPQVLTLLLKWQHPQADDDFLSFACTLDLQSCQQIVKVLSLKQQTRWLALAITAQHKARTIPLLDLILSKIPLQDRHVELACRLNQVALVKHFVSKYQVNVHVTEDKYLREASLNGYCDMVEYLLEGANVDAFHQGALTNAVYHQHVDIVRLLLRNNAVPNHLSVIYAISRNNYDILKLLLEAGANPSCQQDWPLREACKKGLHMVVQLLLAHHANVEANHGEPLKEAMSAGHLNIVELLLDYHANPSSLGALSGLKVARHLNHQHIVDLVLSAVRRNGLT